MSWHDRADGYRIFFNRDERRQRARERPPVVDERDGTRFIAPRDGEAGGSWIAVNEHGLSLCLLNGFPEGVAPSATDGRSYTSRGELPVSLIGFHTTSSIAERLRSLDLRYYRPFVLVAFAPAATGLVADWSGATLELEEHRPRTRPLVSSSFYTESVRDSRVAVYRQLVEGRETGSAAAHRAFHASHTPERGPHSPCMHRPDAHTVSFSGISVDRDEVRFYYAPNSPCRGLPGAPQLSLARRSAHAPTQ